MFLGVPDDMSESESDDCNQRAFEVPPAEEGEDLSAPPMSGEQFLRRVIAESKRLGKTPVVAQLKDLRSKPATYKVPEFPGSKECIEEFKLDRKGQLACLKDFTMLREKIEAKRKQIDHTGMFIKLQTSLRKKEEESEWLEFCTLLSQDKKSPLNLSTATCTAIPQVKVWSLLSYLGEWMEDKQLSIMEGCHWVYCLLACLETPVNPDVHADLRRIARVLIDYRAQMESPDPEVLPHLNLLICIIGRYFEQSDLADPLK